MSGTRKLDNWIMAYSEYAEGTESPPLFHLWVAIGTLAAAMQRKIYMDTGYFEIHSNMYIILVSPPGRSRKSTALRIGKGLLKGALDYGVDLNFSTQASSVAGLVTQFTAISNVEHQSLTSFSSELGSLLGTKSTEMVDFLMDIYDCNPDWDKQTVSRGLEKIKFPWFNLLAATTPQWMGDNLSKTAVEGGFVSRSIFVYDDTRLLVAFPKLTERQKELQKALKHDLAHIAQLKGEMKLSSDAYAFYENWYKSQHDQEHTSDPRLATYFERKHVHVLKVAMALSMSQSDALVIEQRDVETALSLLEQIEPGMYKAFTAVGKNVYGGDLERIRSQVKTSKKGMTYRQLVNANIHAIEREVLDKLLDSLIEMGDIELKQGRVYCATNGAAQAYATSNGAKP